METTSYQPGTPSWVDVGSPDPEASARFYGALFGWKVEEAVPGSGGYRFFTLRGRRVAGLGPQAHSGAPSWSTYIATADAEAVTRAVARFGGRVLMPPTQMMDIARAAVFTDPTGAQFGVWQAGTLAGAGIVDEPGALRFSELATRAADRVIPFYQGVFGWTVREEQTSARSLWELDGRRVGGLLEIDDQAAPADTPARWSAYFAVEDADRAVETVRESGGSVLTPPADIPPGRIATVADPHGAVFSLIKPRTSAA
jgi:uncharacterized protein